MRPRSGLATEYGVTVPNAPGTIDADYRGEVKVLLVNLGDRPVTITRGMRVAQMVIARSPPPKPSRSPNSPRRRAGANVFNSTGLCE